MDDYILEMRGITKTFPADRERRSADPSGDLAHLQGASSRPLSPIPP